MRGMFSDCYTEMMSRKIAFIFGAITLIAMLIGYATGQSELSIQMQGLGDSDVAELDKVLSGTVLPFIDMYLSILVILATMAVAGLFPQMMKKGRADYFLAKPISRPTLFAYRYISIFVIYGGLIFVSGLISYLSFSLVSGIYGASVSWILLGQMINFCLWLTVVSFVGIMSGSGGVAIMSSFIVWLAQILLQGHESFSQFLDNAIFENVLTGLYYVLPKMSQISDIGINMAAGLPVEDWMPLWSSILFGLGALLLSALLFRRKDY